jgi:hypothetical protein
MAIATYLPYSSAPGGNGTPCATSSTTSSRKGGQIGGLLGRAQHHAVGVCYLHDAARRGETSSLGRVTGTWPS